MSELEQPSSEREQALVRLNKRRDFWAIGLVLNAWDVYYRAPITEADVQREIERSHPHT